MKITELNIVMFYLKGLQMSRIILKISGEALKDEFANVSSKKLNIVLETVNNLKKLQHDVAIVVGGGNYFRGRENTDMDVVTRDTIGMLGTCMNALYIKDYLERNGISTTISTPFDFPNLIENLNNDELKEKWHEGNVIVFGGGIGKSGYSTDSGVIYAAEKIGCDLIIKMTNVDGVYDSDPKINKNAKKFNQLTYEEVLNEHYKVMDEFAIQKAQEKNIKILVMNFLE